MKSDDIYDVVVDNNGNVVISKNGENVDSIIYIKNELVSFVVKVYDENGVPLTGATFQVTAYVPTASGETIYRLDAESFQDGATFAFLRPGDYTLEETTAPAHYEKSSDTYKIRVTEEGRVLLLTDENPDGVEYTPVVYTNKALSTASIDVCKVDENDDPLAGVSFVLKVDKDGVAGDVVYKAVSDENGIATFTKMLPGRYILAEDAAPSGYVKSDDSYSLWVNEYGHVVLFTDNEPNGTLYQPVTVINQAKPSTSDPVNPDSADTGSADTGSADTGSANTVSVNTVSVDTGDVSLLPALGTLLISGAAFVVLLKLRKRRA